MKKYIVVIFVFVAFSISHAQSPGPYYRQFFFNPYVFNPAYVGINNQPEVNLIYRQQWVNFKDAPVTTGINIQVPTAGRVVLGANIFTEKQVLLRTSSFTATFGYVVPIDEKQTLRFALSGGVGLNSLDLTSEELDTNDPAIMNAANNNYYADGNFGAVYTNGGLRLGFALTKLFASDPFTSENFNQFSISNLKNRIYSASYRFHVGVMENISIEPYVLYKQRGDGLQDSWEAASIVYFKDKFWTGASYNQNDGLAAFLGLNVLDKFRFSYSYEFPPLRSGVPSYSSHELHLNFRFGKKKLPPGTKRTVVSKTQATSTKKVEKKKNEPDSTTEEEVSTVIDPTGETKEELSEEVITDEPTVPPTVETVETTVPNNNVTTSEKTVTKPNEITDAAPTPKKPPVSFTLQRGFYVVVGSFNILENSMYTMRRFNKTGYTTNVALHPKNNRYYVYIFSTYDHDEARRVRNQYRLKNLFSEAWVLTVE